MEEEDYVRYLDHIQTPTSTMARPSIDGRSPTGAFIAQEVGERGGSGPCHVRTTGLPAM